MPTASGTVPSTGIQQSDRNLRFVQGDHEKTSIKQNISYVSKCHVSLKSDLGLGRRCQGQDRRSKLDLVGNLTLRWLERKAGTEERSGKRLPRWMADSDCLLRGEMLAGAVGSLGGPAAPPSTSQQYSGGSTMALACERLRRRWVGEFSTIWHTAVWLLWA